MSQQLESGWFRGRTGAGGTRQVLGPPHIPQGEYLTVHLSIYTVMKIIFSITDSRISPREGSTKEMLMLGRNFDILHRDRRLRMAGAQITKTIELLCMRKCE